MSDILFFDKMTDGKYRWKMEIGNGVAFKLYIPIWRTPDEVEIPPRISVSLHLPNDPSRPIIVLQSKVDFSNNKTLKHNKIASRIIAYDDKMVHTIRYRPAQYGNECPIGEPYIPITLLKDRFGHIPSSLFISVEWL